MPMRPLDRAVPRRRQSGFTLAEIAIVLVIITILASVFILPLGGQIEARQRAEARTTLDDIRSALIGYAIIHNRLPCPTTVTDTTDPTHGTEPASSPPCAAVTADGFLPWRQLGVPSRDPWGGYWRYRVDSAFATNIASNTATAQNLIVRDHSGADLTLTSDNTGVFIVYSTGANLQPDGLNATYESGSTATYEAGEPTTTFDDMVTWIGRPLLIARLAEAGAF